MWHSVQELWHRHNSCKVHTQRNICGIQFRNCATGIIAAHTEEHMSHSVQELCHRYNTQLHTQRNMWHSVQELWIGIIQQQHTERNICHSAQELCHRYSIIAAQTEEHVPFSSGTVPQEQLHTQRNMCFIQFRNCATGIAAHTEEHVFHSVQELWHKFKEHSLSSLTAAQIYRMSIQFRNCGSRLKNTP